MTKSVRVLGIETSCDETAAAVVENGRLILSNVIASQVAIHQPYAGIVPELASRAHVENVQTVIQEALKNQHVRGASSFPKSLPVDVVAVTVGPGLTGSLLIGKVVAEMMAWAYCKPLVPVNHLEGHLLSALPASRELEPPFLALVVSGGHTELIHVKDYGSYHVLGRTRDDAAGEAFDKVARMLGLGYPGGPHIDKLAARGNPKAIPFPRAFLSDGWDFSFSGLKTSVFYYVRDNPAVKDNKKKLGDVCASFQQAVVDVLVHKALAAAEKLKCKHLVVAGGVSANNGLRAAFAHHATKCKVHMASPLLCTDNAVMIAVAGFYKYQKMSHKKFLPRAMEVDSSLRVEDWAKGCL